MKSLSILAKVLFSVVFVFIMANAITFAVPAVTEATGEIAILENVDFGNTTEGVVTTLIAGFLLACSIAIPGIAIFSGAIVPNFGALIANISDPNVFVDKVKKYLSYFGVNRIDISKTLGDYCAFDTLGIKGETTLRFFQGQRAVATQTNQPNGFVRQQDEHLIITGIQLMSSDDTAAAWGAVPFENGVIAPELLDATMDISVNGVVMLKKLPLNNFLQVAEEAQSGFMQLATPIVWQGQTELALTISIPTASATTNQIWLQVKLHGLGFFS